MRMLGLVGAASLILTLTLPSLLCGQTIGQFHLGEFVNRFRHGSLVMKLPDSEAAKIPTVLFGTINGSIGVIASLPQQQFAYLSRLQVQAGHLCNFLGRGLCALSPCCVTPHQATGCRSTAFPPHGTVSLQVLSPGCFRHIILAVHELFSCSGRAMLLPRPDAGRAPCIQPMRLWLMRLCSWMMGVLTLIPVHTAANRIVAASSLRFRLGSLIQIDILHVPCRTA